MNDHIRNRDIYGPKLPRLLNALEADDQAAVGIEAAEGLSRVLALLTTNTGFFVRRDPAPGNVRVCGSEDVNDLKLKNMIYVEYCSLIGIGRCRHRRSCNSEGREGGSRISVCRVNLIPSR